MSGIEWTVAALAPWAIAPHPNFASGSARAVQLLALVADYRLNELDRYLPLLADGTPDAERALVIDAAAAIRLESQETSTPRVASWCTSEDLPIGARVAAALIAASCFAERDQLAESISVVETAMNALSDLAEDSNADSVRIMRASLLLSRALRALELGDRSLARADSEATIEMSGTSDLLAFEDFAVSESIGWSSSDVQIDVLQCLNLHARQLWSALAPIRDNSWVGLVRSRPNWLDVRAQRRSFPGLEEFLTEAFAEKFDAHSRSVRFSSEDGIIAPLEASLFNAEVTSSFSVLNSRRSQLGKLRLLRVGNSPNATNAIVDGIGLLRRARDKKALEPALRNIRAIGPLAPLKVAGKQVLRIAERRQLNRYDLLVLAGAAELFDESELQASVNASFQFLDSGEDEPGSTQGLAGWTRVEAGWRAIISLAPHSNYHGQIADSALSLLSSNESPYLLSGLISRVVDAIDWQRVSRSTIGEWRMWASEQTSAEFADLAWHILDSVPDTAVVPAQREITRPTGIALAERIVIESQRGEPVLPAELAEATAAIMDELVRIRSEAARGSFAVGGRSAPLIAAHLATRLDADDVWRPLIDLLKSPTVAAVDKTRCLGYLSGQLDNVPKVMRNDLVDNWRDVNSAPEDPFSGRGSFEFVGASLTLGVRIGAIASSDFVARVTELSCGSPAEQIEALHCLAYADIAPEFTQTIATLAVQLSLSIDPSVQANAAYVLGRRIELESAMRDLMVRRLTESMLYDAIRVPLLALQGLGDAAPAISARTRDRLAEAVSRLATEHLAVSVRNEASGLLASWDGNGDPEQSSL